MTKPRASDRYFKRGDNRDVRTLAEWTMWVAELNPGFSANEAHRRALVLIREGELIGPLGEPA